MAVDLNDQVTTVKDAVNPPGLDLYEDATDDDWLNRLIHAFWKVRLMGMLNVWEENAASRSGITTATRGIITPLGAVEGYDDPDGYDPNTDLPPELQALVPTYAAWLVTVKSLEQSSTGFSAKAGPVEFEQQNSATVYKTVLDQLKADLDFIIEAYSRFGGRTGVSVFDSVIERSYQVTIGNQGWWR